MTDTATPGKRAWVEQIMGMPISIHLRGPGLTRGETAVGDARSGTIDAAVTAAFESLREVDATFSTYRADSPISRLARGELRLRDAAAQGLFTLGLAPGLPVGIGQVEGGAGELGIEREGTLKRNDGVVDAALA